MGVTNPSAKIGIQPGGVILSLNGVPVSSVQELRTLVDRAGRHVTPLVQRDDTKIFMPVDLDWRRPRRCGTGAITAAHVASLGGRLSCSTLRCVRPIWPPGSSRGQRVEQSRVIARSSAVRCRESSNFPCATRPISFAAYTGQSVWSRAAAASRNDCRMNFYSSSDLGRVTSGRLCYCTVGAVPIRRQSFSRAY